MAVWSSNHRACTTTWSTLLVLTQIQEAFPKAGAIPMTDLAFWAGSDDARRTRAETLAQQVDNIFRQLRGAKYEEGVAGEDAIQKMVAQLLTQGGTVADLAEVSDALYLFWKEAED
jgi:hypothetical protein